MNSSPNIAPDLVRKYEANLPRYTSYPTTQQFHAEFGETQFLEHAQYSNTGLLPKDLSIYVHIPSCHPLVYSGDCNKLTTKTNNKKIEEYLERLCREIAMVSQLFSDDRLVTQIGFGSSASKLLGPDQITDILEQIAIQFHLDLPKKLEIGIKIAPSATADDISKLAMSGFNQFSIGIHGCFNEGQKALNNEPDEAATMSAITAAMATGGTVNVDLTVGLANQTIRSFARFLDNIVATGVSRITAHNFAYPPKHLETQNKIGNSSLPDKRTRRELVQLVQQKLLSSGYQHIGMGHYALPSDSLTIARMNNKLQRDFHGGYTTHKDTDVIGVGASAISEFDTALSQNESKLSLYNELVDANTIPVSKGLALSDDDRIRAGVIQQVMCQTEVDLSHSISLYIERNSDVALASYFSSELEKLAPFKLDGLIGMTTKGFTITDNGRYFIRAIASVFDRYQNTDGSDDQIIQFSRATKNNTPPS